jgi:hypothetical protein
MPINIDYEMRFVNKDGKTTVLLRQGSSPWLIFTKAQADSICFGITNANAFVSSTLTTLYPETEGR